MGKLVTLLCLLIFLPALVLSADMEFTVQPIVTSRDFDRLLEYVNGHISEKEKFERSFCQSLKPGLSHKEVSLLWHKYFSSGYSGGREVDARSTESVDYTIMKCGDSSIFLFFNNDALYGWSQPSWVKVNGRILTE